MDETRAGSMETLEESSNIETRVDSNEHDDFHDIPTTKTTDLKHDARKDNPREDNMKPEGDESAPVTIDREALSSATLPSVIIASPDSTPENEKEYVIVGQDTETASDAAHDVEPSVDDATLVSSNSSKPVASSAATFCPAGTSHSRRGSVDWSVPSTFFPVEGRCSCETCSGESAVAWLVS